MNIILNFVSFLPLSSYPWLNYCFYDVFYWKFYTILLFVYSSLFFIYQYLDFLYIIEDYEIFMNPEVFLEFSHHKQSFFIYFLSQIHNLLLQACSLLVFLTFLLAVLNQNFFLFINSQKLEHSLSLFSIYYRSSKKKLQAFFVKLIQINSGLPKNISYYLLDYWDELKQFVV